jgi:transcriptional regulator with XRE-family HTH domain
VYVDGDLFFGDECRDRFDKIDNVRHYKISEGQMTHVVDSHVGQKIRQRRWMVGMTQQQLAESVGIKFQQIQKYETGMNRVSASRLWDISRALGVSASFFFEGLSENAEEPAAEDQILQQKETLELLRSYYAIPEGQRKRFLHLAQSLGDFSTAS